MTAPVPTPEDVEAMRERHVALPPDGSGAVWCANPVCCQGWPCDAARLLALVDNQRVTLDEDALYMAERDARLAAVLAECDRYDQGEGDIAPEDGWRLLRDVRRAATPTPRNR